MSKDIEDKFQKWFKEEILKKELTLYEYCKSAFIAGSNIKNIKDDKLEWKTFNISTPDGVDFRLSIMGNVVRIRRFGWKPLEIFLNKFDNEINSINIKEDTVIKENVDEEKT